jgi:phospholipid-transporting ATPase
MIISGDALSIIFHQDNSDHQMKETFITIAELCKTVLCCRVSPKQKEEVVTLVRQFKMNSPTLAIGDGANDVSMITAAHVGVGIRGVEG